MSDDEHYIANKVPGRVYGSKSFEMKQPLPGRDGEVPPVRRARYLDRVFPDIEGDAFGIVRNELVLRTSPSGKRQVKLFVVEDPRHIRSLVVQSFTVKDDGAEPSKKVHFTLYGSEIDDFVEIASLAKEAEFQTGGKFRIDVNNLQRLDITPEAARTLVASNVGLLESILSHEVTQRDLVATAFRKKQIKRFESLLRDSEYFSSEQKTVPGNGEEAVWQRFFEGNHWIFGGTLFMASAGAIDIGKLERVVSGYSVAGPGKRTDALLRTRGRIGALCFVEIKCHTTPLQKPAAYRPGVWAASEHLVGAVTQIQRTVQLAEQTIRGVLRPKDGNGDTSGPDAYLIRPRTVVVCGDLEQFISDGIVNEDKYSSFELFRRHLQGPEIVTFDELLERAKLMVDGG